jgi:hypothetical protein
VTRVQTEVASVLTARHPVVRHAPPGRPTPGIALQADALDGSDPDAAPAADATTPGTEVAASTSGRPAEEEPREKGKKSALRR